MRDRKPPRNPGHPMKQKTAREIHLCGAKTRGGGTCKRPGKGAGGRCRLHGGASLVGRNSPTWKHGRWSKYLPEALAAKFQEGLDDPELMKLRQDTALIDAALTDFADRVKKGKGLNYRQRKELIDLTEQRRKLIESDARRQRDLNLWVAADRVMQLMGAVAEVVREFVDRDKLPKAQARLQQLLLGQNQVIDLNERNT